MLREGVAIVCLVLRKTGPGAFTPRQVELLETFAARSVIAIENVRLFTEIQEKSRQLEIASQHRSQFLANMSQSRISASSSSAVWRGRRRSRVCTRSGMHPTRVHGSRS